MTNIRIDLGLKIKDHKKILKNEKEKQEYFKRLAIDLKGKKRVFDTYIDRYPIYVFSINSKLTLTCDSTWFDIFTVNI